jgi:hypothetical protein
VEHAQEAFQVSERQVCWALEQPRSSQRYHGNEADDEEILTERMVIMASQYGRYGYCRITAMLQMDGWQVNHKRVEANLASGRAESAQETTQTRQIVAERRFLPSAKTGVS